MLWMETVRLRANKNAQSEVLKIIETFKKELQKSAKLLNWHIYRHVMISGDFSIIIQWNTAQIDQEGSILAHNFVKILAPIGVVDHSIWIAQTGLRKERGD